MIVGLIRPNEGVVYLDDKDITSLPMYKRAQLGIGYLPQEASVFRKLSVEDNILAVLEMIGASKKEQNEKLESLLDEFGLQHVRKNRGDLSPVITPPTLPSLLNSTSEAAKPGNISTPNASACSANQRHTLPILTI